MKESQKAVLQKYLVGDETTWENVVERVCEFVSGADPEKQGHWYKEFYSIIEPMKLVPGGSIIGNSSHGTKGMLNCFVLSSEDNIHDITKLVSDAVLTTKFRGGVGINIGAEGQAGYIRPKGTPFKDGKALGPCAVLDMVSENANKITTGNRSRRGAFLFSMHWKHPDIWEFIQAKTESKVDAEWAMEMIQRSADGEDISKELNEGWIERHLNPEGKRDRRWHNANISVQLDDEFFTLLDSGDFDAQRLWDGIAQNAHDTADPGLLLVDNAKRRSPIRDYILCTNPCGEIWLPPNSACNLASLVITKFVNKKSDGAIEIDWEDLRKTVRASVRFLDYVLDVSEFATPDQKHNVQNVFRQLGLGIMGWSDYLKMARIPYDSEEHLEEIERWGSSISNWAYEMSEELAKERGACGIWEDIKEVKTGNPFESWADHLGSTHSGDEILECDKDLKLEQFPRRNSTVLCIAPTGSIAQLADCSWAFEPDFGLSVWKQVFVDASKGEQNWVQLLSPYIEDLKLSEADQEIVKQTGSLSGTEFANKNPEEAKSFKIAREISPEWHIRVQSAWQNWIDSSITKTINLPKEATVEEIKQIYRFSESQGLKGVTIYRSGTLDSEPIKVGNEEKEAEKPRECRSGNCEI